MADKPKDIAELSPYSALGFLRSFTDNLNTDKPTSSQAATPATYAGTNVPQGKIAVSAQNTELAKKFVSSSSDFDVSKKPEEGMDVFTWMMLMRSHDSVKNGMDSDTNVLQNFKDLIKTLGLESTEVNFGGKVVTLGELSNKLSTSYQNGDFPQAGYPMGVLGQARFAPNSPVAARALENAERLADQKGVLGAIQSASRIVGVDTNYMLLKAKQESGFNPHAQARTSSAGGLYQFLDRTWIATANKHKDLLERHMGIDVDDLSRGQLLSLKNNAMASALMGAAFAKDNKDYLERNVNVPGGFRVNSGALYMAHFLGPAGAEKFYEGLARNPNASAASLFPQAAASNASVFRGKSLADLNDWSAGKMGAPSYTVFT